MWILRRRLELYFLLFALLPLYAGLHLPPPVADTYVVVGTVEHLRAGNNATNLAFSVSRRRLSSHWLEPGYAKLRSSIREGQQVRAVVWSWLDQDGQILELSLDDGEQLVTRKPRQVLYWAVSFVFLGMAGMLWWVAAWGFRSKEALWEKYKRSERRAAERKRERAARVP